MARDALLSSAEVRSVAAGVTCLGDSPQGKGRIARALYIAANEQRVVILRAFVKKTEKTPGGWIPG
jgi:phage-related protein